MSGKKIANHASRKGESSESVKHRVRLFLVKNPESGLAKIHRGIETNFTKEGLNGILKQLVEDGEIENIAVKPKDPRYVLRDIETFNSQVEGYTMKDYLSVIGLDLHVDRTIIIMDLNHQTNKLYLMFDFLKSYQPKYHLQK